MLALALVVAAAAAAVQDAHYWTNQYGTRGELVGGLVVGSFLDLRATFYNPGAIIKFDFVVLEFDFALLKFDPAATESAYSLPKWQLAMYGKGA